MSVETPATIAILGAGPIGLEAALYARFLGYDVRIFERGDVASNVLGWRHVKMFTPFSMNSTPLGLAAITAQDPNYAPPPSDAVLMGAEFHSRYLLPLAQTDLLASCIFSNVTVQSVVRKGWPKSAGLGTEERADAEFTLGAVDHRGQARMEDADVVIDTTGTFGNPNEFGFGGLPAVGQNRFQTRIRTDVPDVLGRDRNCYENQRTLLIGAGLSAATTVSALAELATSSPATKITWLVRRPQIANAPIQSIPGDPLSERIQLTSTANACSQHECIQLIQGKQVARIEPSGQALAAHVVDADTANMDVLEVDQIIANVGYRPNNSIFQELQVHLCYATEGPMQLAAALMEHPDADCMSQRSHGPESLRTTEPNFYILGSKSYGRNSHFLLSIGHQQIRDLFSVIGDRVDLDLYSSVQPRI